MFNFSRGLYFDVSHGEFSCYFICFSHYKNVTSQNKHNNT